MFSLKAKEGGGPPPVQPPRQEEGSPIMKIALAACFVAIVALAFGGYSSTSGLEDSVTVLEEDNMQAAETIDSMQKDAGDMASDLDVVRKKLGVTAQELDASRKYAERLRAEQEQARQQISSELANKANSTDVAA